MTGPGHLIELAPGWSLWRLCALRGAGMPWSWLDRLAGDPAESANDARDRAAASVRAVVREPRFLEAVLWQNSALVENWLGAYADRLAVGDNSLSRRGQREALVAFLAQRYCAKNETIGFFGPVAWAEFDRLATGLRSAGGGGLRSRTLHVEGWAVRALAEALAADERLAGDLTVRRHPAASVRDGVLTRPGRKPVALDAVPAAVFATLARPSTMRALLTTPERRDAVERLRADGAIVVGIPVPHGGDPYGSLTAFVDELPDEALRAEIRARLAEFTDRVERVGKAAGDPAALRTALAETEQVFTALVGQDARRDKPAQRYGRALVYEDCRRDLDVAIGADLIDGLRRPLALLLDSARWFVAELGLEVEADLTRRYRDLAARGRDVTVSDLVFVSGDVLNGLPGTAVTRVADDFQARWAELLATVSDVGTLRLDCARAARLAAALFPARPISWRAAVQHSPDLMIDIGVDGTARWVLGELHMALNTLENRPFLTQADSPDALSAASAADFAAGRIVPLYPPDSPEVTSRTYPPLAMDRPDLYTYWSYAADHGHADGAPSLPGAGLRVSVRDGRLVARDDGSGIEAPVLEFLGEFLTALAVDRFKLRAPAAYRQRLLFDDVVVERESWRVPAITAPVDRSDYRCLALRSWLIDLGAPRHVFVRTPGAPKPILVDRDAPLLLQNLARALRQADPAAVVDIVEMLPGPGGLWLSDAAGERHTSEFRIVAVDTWQDVSAPVVTTDAR
jgi:hypothetical protein